MHVEIGNTWQPRQNLCQDFELNKTLIVITIRHALNIQSISILRCNCAIFTEQKAYLVWHCQLGALVRSAGLLWIILGQKHSIEIVILFQGRSLHAIHE